MFISKRCGCSSKDGKNCIPDKRLGKLADNLTLLSVKSRLELLFLLKDKPHCVCDLTVHTDMSQSLVSHHLADLVKAKIIGYKREGKYLDYFLTEKGRKIIETLSVLQ